jgi:hypothetical protein
MKSTEFLKELLNKQLKNISSDKKLKYNDLKRLCKYIDSNIFDENKCCLWTGYITNINNVSKGIYINFYFNGKKAALHRLLYINFVGELMDDEYLKFNCINKGKCCNIFHLKKFKYIKKHQIIDTKKNIEDIQIKLTTQESEKKSFKLSFE